MLYLGSKHILKCLWEFFPNFWIFRSILFVKLINFKNNKISCFSTVLKSYQFIYAGDLLDATFLEVQPVFVADAPISVDLKLKFRNPTTPVNFSGHLGRLRRKPTPAQGSSRHSLLCGVFLFSNPCPII
jgi:hypothetical protein